jgi:hypothetical protein
MGDNRIGMERTKGTLSSVVTSALSSISACGFTRCFKNRPRVPGLRVFMRRGRRQIDLEHGDCGLGTFANLDGEMVVLDGRVYQVQGTGRVSEDSPDAGAPFDVVTRFSPQADVETARPSRISKTSKLAATNTATRRISSMRSAWTGASGESAPVP